MSAGRPRRLTEITLFTRGDATKVSTWSSLPHGCADALEALGMTVHRVGTNPGLDGCYELGQHYPDLCSSMFLMCERGEKR